MTPRRRLITFAVVAGVFGLLAAVQVIYFQRGLIPGDAFVYLAAGERLNAGHDLYALMPGDRPVGINPPYWTVVFVSPPPMAVVFRPFALLPGDIGAYAWWGCQLTALATAIALLMRRRPLLTAAALLVLLVPLVYEIGVGNVNSFLLLGLILTWRSFVIRRDAVAGGLAAVMTALKATPGIVGWWLVTQRRPRAVRAFVGVGVAVACLSVLGAGLPDHLRYLEVLGNGSVGPSPLSLGGMLEFVGLPAPIARVVPFAAALAGVGAVWALRDRPALSFGASVLTMIAGSPAVSINWYVLLFALLAPIAWPLPREAQLAVPRARPLPAGPQGVPADGST